MQEPLLLPTIHDHCCQGISHWHRWHLTSSNVNVLRISNCSIYIYPPATHIWSQLYLLARIDTIAVAAAAGALTAPWPPLRINKDRPALQPLLLSQLILKYTSAASEYVWLQCAHQPIKSLL
jgi:hypothetical protein